MFEFLLLLYFLTFFIAVDRKNTKQPFRNNQHGKLYFLASTTEFHQTSDWSMRHSDLAGK